jgi:iron-sulfur cluster repair protein YtfE (RIC family)
MRAEDKGAPNQVCGAQEEDLLLMLAYDHQLLLELFARVEETGNDRDAVLKLFSRIERELQMHMEGEERFFYTALERHDRAREMVLEGFEEHHLAKLLLSAFKTLALDDERWGPRLRVLRRVAQLHMEREERELFPAARDLLGQDQMRAIAGQIVQLKREGITS